MTNIKTLKGTSYPVSGLKDGKIIARQPSGKARYLSVADVGRARFDGAVAHYLAEQKRSRA